MQTVLRKRGKSVALIVPDAVLEQTGAGVETEVNLRVVDGRLIITPIREVWKSSGDPSHEPAG